MIEQLWQVTEGKPKNPSRDCLKIFDPIYSLLQLYLSLLYTGVTI